MNNFLNSVSSNDARTRNGAVSHSTSGSNLLDYFGKAGSYRDRDISLVSADMASIFGEDETLAMKAVLYNRMVTRKIGGELGTEKVQKGQGQKDEFIKSIKWLEQSRPYLLYRNIHLIPAVGKWSDLWYDSASTGLYHYVKEEVVYALVANAIKRGDDILAKHLPKIRSRSNTTSDRHKRLNTWARGLCKYLGWTEKDYRKFKSSGQATRVQTQMCAGEWDKIDFKQIPGKALFKLMSKGKDGKNAIERHGLSKKYESWIESQPVAKFTGYVYELYNKANPVNSWGAPSGNRSYADTVTINKQFDGMLELAKKDGSEMLSRGVWCALDTSGSMAMNVGQNVKAIDVCVGLGIYFSSLIEGAFKDHVVMFDDVSKVKKLSGTFCDKVDQINREDTAWGSTNFQSVIDSIVRTRNENPEIPVSDYPEVLLVVSDMQFNPCGSNETNYKNAMKKLEKVGLPAVEVIWWNVNGMYGKDVPNKKDDVGVTMISGFDGAIVSNLLGAEDVVDEKTGEKRRPTAEEMMLNALDQEILNKVVV